MLRSSLPFRFCFLILLLPFAVSANAQDSMRPVQVHLFDGDSPETATLQIEEGHAELLAGDHEAAIAELKAGESATLAVRGQDVRITTADGSLFAQSLRVSPSSEARWSLKVRTKNGRQDARTYTGALRVVPSETGALQLVNAVDLEDYVAGVVTSEYGLDDLEGAKAMAVAARTYALRSSGKFGLAFDHVDHTSSQMYRGLSDVTPLAQRAAQETRGEVLTYDGELIEAVYFSSSGGRTADNDDVWDSQPRPYLRAKADPYDDLSPHGQWRTTVNRSQLLRRLSQEHGFEVRGFVIGDHSEGGRVKAIELLGPGSRKKEISANDFRLFVNEQTGGLGLRSTFFDARRAGGQYVFEGKGYGHGVGLSQYGAHAMAQQGHSYRDILQFYYTGVEIESLDGVDAPRPLDAIVADNQEESEAEEEEREEQPATSSSKSRIGW